LRKPKIVYPIVKNYSEPIEVHVVEGETVILECVIADSVSFKNCIELIFHNFRSLDGTSKLQMTTKSVKFGVTYELEMSVCQMLISTFATVCVNTIWS
jgi:hypothetical protein